MIIKTLEELEQHIGKFVVLSEYPFDSTTQKPLIMKQLTKIEEGWINRQVYNNSTNTFYGYNLWGKYTAQINPFTQYVINSDKITYGNQYQYARTPTKKELRYFAQN